MNPTNSEIFPTAVIADSPERRSLSSADSSPLHTLTEADFIHHGPYEESSDVSPSIQTSHWKDVWIRYQTNRPALCGLLILFVLFSLAVVGPFISSHSYFHTDLERANLPPSSTYWFGTDDLGRDIFTRTWYGARISLSIGIMAALIDACIGVLWGSIAAFAGGVVDTCMMRLADVLYGLPYLMVVILLLVVMEPGIIPILIAMTLVGWITMARIVRAQILQIKQQEYVLAARALGASSTRILFKHLIPNAMAPILVTMTLTIPLAIFVEAFLSFLGLGIQAPMASWGTMANEGLPAFQFYPWRLFFPALFICLTMLAFNLGGDGLRDALDPRLKK